MTMSRICIVTPGHLASNPRVVKEAAALHEAGYEVTVVAGDVASFVRPFDDELLARVPWRTVRVGRPALSGRIETRLAAIVARNLPASILAADLCAIAYSEQSRGLRRAAIDVQADLYIGHYVAGLSAAAYAMRRNKGLLGYDAEDFHAGELADTEARPEPSRLSGIIERSFLPECRHFTASSPLIGQAYEAAYARRPEIVLNVFPLAMMPAQPGGPSHSPVGHLRAYWFSQTIGLDRGLQAFIRAMAKARSHITLDVRGSNEDWRAKALLALAEELGVGGRISLLPMAPPDGMVELAAQYDIGLSMEPGFSENNRRALGNKIFTYLLAGTPVLMSDTPAQRLLAKELGEAAAVISIDDSDGIADQLDRWAFSTAYRQRARAAARERAMTCYNWDLEKQILLKSVASALGRR
jgi:glycosyltransferase involved in cell wall biosynthesis